MKSVSSNNQNTISLTYDYTNSDIEKFTETKNYTQTLVRVNNNEKLILLDTINSEVKKYWEIKLDGNEFITIGLVTSYDNSYISGKNNKELISLLKEDINCLFKAIYDISKHKNSLTIAANNHLYEQILTINFDINDCNQTNDRYKRPFCSSGSRTPTRLKNQFLSTSNIMNLSKNKTTDSLQNIRINFSRPPELIIAPQKKSKIYSDSADLNDPYKKSLPLKSVSFSDRSRAFTIYEEMNEISFNSLKKNIGPYEEKNLIISNGGQTINSNKKNGIVKASTGSNRKTTYQHQMHQQLDSENGYVTKFEDFDPKIQNSHVDQNLIKERKVSNKINKENSVEIEDENYETSSEISKKNNQY